MDHARIAQAETDAPASHVVTFGHREDLDGHFLGPIHLQNAGRFEAVKTKVRVGEIVQDHRAVLQRQANHALEEFEINARRSGVVRIAEQNHLGLAGAVLVEILKAVEVLGRVGRRQRDGLAFGHDDAVLVNRITGRWSDNAVARSDHGKHHVRQCVFGADGDDGLSFRVELDAVVALVTARDLVTKIWDAARNRVAMVARDAGGLDEFSYHGARRSAIRVAHSEIHYVVLRSAQTRLHFIDGGENVGWQLGYSVKLVWW